MATPETETKPSPPTPLWRRLLPLALLVAIAAAAYAAFGDKLSFQTLADNREALIAWRDGSYVFAAVAFVAAYALVVALSLPGALWMTLAGGFLFGLWPGGLFNIGAATIGAIAIFLVARSSLGAALKERAGPWLDKFEEGFRKNEVSYLLIMRLVPAVPFFVANLAPAFLGVKLRTFALTTFFGIMPGGLVYTWVGAGLGEVLDEGGEPDLSILFEPHVIGPILGLAALSALPIALSYFRRERADA